MKVPKAIQDAIRKSAKANAVAREADSIIRQWMKKNNAHNDSVIDQLIDCCELSNNPDAFIEFLESDSFRKGNDEHYD